MVFTEAELAEINKAAQVWKDANPYLFHCPDCSGSPLHCYVFRTKKFRKDKKGEHDYSLGKRDTLEDESLIMCPECGTVLVIAQWDGYEPGLRAYHPRLDEWADIFANPALVKTLQFWSASLSLSRSLKEIDEFLKRHPKDE